MTRFEKCFLNRQVGVKSD